MLLSPAVFESCGSYSFVRFMLGLVLCGIRILGSHPGVQSTAPGPAHWPAEDSDPTVRYL
jgi:hypothetical protein